MNCGRRAMTVPFGILRLPLSLSSRKMHSLLCTCKRLLNLWTRFFGLNQLFTMYSNDADDIQPWVVRLGKEQKKAPLDIRNG